MLFRAATLVSARNRAAFMKLASANRRQESDSPEPTQIPSRRGGRYWAAQIKKALEAGSNFEIGVVVHQARIECPHGEWMVLWETEESPFGIGKAEKLAKVGERLGWINSSDRENLPTALG